MRVKTVFAHDKFDLSVHVFGVDGLALLPADSPPGQSRLFVSPSSSINVKHSFGTQNPEREQKERELMLSAKENQKSSATNAKKIISRFYRDLNSDRWIQSPEC
jgi:hypothetical protein